ncbi:MAG: hypothetical protein HKO76_05465 [Acidimicrobiia bacterium]|nr:hypothetical protein [Acidimicrobiia bacterium]
MRWDKVDNPNVIDRRGRRGGGGGGRSIAVGGGGLGLIGLLIMLFLGGMNGNGGGAGDILNDVLGGAQAPAAPSDPVDQPPAQDDTTLFINWALADIQDTWDEIFRAAGQNYPRARLVLFEGREPSGCGGALGQYGPHYCPADQNVYIDLAFFNDPRMDIEGDFALAYVIAHEIGHHVQQVTGISDQVRRLQQQSGQAQANDLSVRLELQADCFAGVWGHATYQDNRLESGDFDEAIRAAEAVGDDTIARNAGVNRPNPETFTHGTSQQRINWFRQGFDTGDPDQCDTFNNPI